MSWPTPHQHTNTRIIPSWGQHHPSHQPFRRSRSKQKDTFAKSSELRYGLGCFLGLLTVHYTKTLIRRIPLIGKVASPLLGLFPTLVVGPALGASVVYVLEVGDPEVARRNMERHAHRVSGEVKSVVRDLEAVARKHVARYEERAQRLGAALEETVEDLHRDLAPVLSQNARRADQELRNILR
ncbi:hypothetical protein CEUSTIGMA_g936.t1 [Chlamydomonas eustigma]|uniref:Uncharacterized protein n=1 Tax=Chlamydomonas eustigma TaxID=1157962 RepID=A0A250WRK7_9CHLO|nr:hypothetical protein CEUSTIGMA_g936.t1 [Chlamydomonas eustigma]|eukprot:GAX73484.1 hypothetical protein CEUSTIGMA_g936.t1 [Chlamydomonas eustigma]